MNEHTSNPSSAALALHLAGRGFPVFPCDPATKRPLTPHGFKDASTDPATVADFWSRHPAALVGMPTGKESGVFALDLDIDETTGEARGEAWLASAGLSDLLQGPGAVTPSGGRHVYFSAAGLAEGLRNTAGKAAPNVDTRGEGGYIIAPGSEATAGRYSPANGGLFASSLPALPEALLAALESKPEALAFTIDTGRASYHDARADLAEAQEIVRHIPPDCGYGDWVAVLMGLHAHFVGSEAALDLADRWSAQGSKYKHGEVAAKWRGFAPGGGTNWATVCALARQNGADLADIARRHKRGGASSGANRGEDAKPGDTDDAKAEAGEFFSAADLEGQPIPPRQWHVPDLIPARTVTTLNGDGGTGKSLAALQLAVATALGRPWLGQLVTPGRALFISAEDDRDEIHRRLADVAEAEGVKLADLHNLDLRSLAGKDALLAVPKDKSEVMQETPLFKTLDKWIGENKPALTVLDTLADLFGGNEVSRTQARQFIGMLRGLAVRHGTTVLLLAHPSLAGISTGTGSSGSTAWNNSVRSRLYLRRLAAEGEEGDPDARELEVMKANYSRKGALLPLRWIDGVFHLDAKVETGLDRMAASAKAERVFLKMLRSYTEQGRFVSANPGSTFAPSVFAANTDAAEGCTKRALRAAMDSHFAAKRIVNATHGAGAKARSHLAIAGDAT